MLDVELKSGYNTFVRSVGNYLRELLVGLIIK